MNPAIVRNDGFTVATFGTTPQPGRGADTVHAKE